VALAGSAFSGRSYYLTDDGLDRYLRASQVPLAAPRMNATRDTLASSPFLFAFYKAPNHQEKQYKPVFSGFKGSAMYISV
jgi:hypothetical protein